MSTTVQASDKSLKSLFLASSALSIVLGLVLLIWPGRSTIVVAWIAMLFIAISAIERIIAIFGRGKSVGIRVLNAFGAAISIFLVFWVFSFRGSEDAITVGDYFGIGPASIGAVLMLGIVVGINWMVGGIIAVSQAMTDEDMSKRGLMVGWGILSIFAGFFVLLFPASILWFAIFFGVFLLITGIVGLIVTLATKK